MINYKDLMIGDWVYESERSKFPMKVVSVGENYCYLDFPNNEGDVFDGYEKDMMPIEVTDELLIKIGFKKLSGGIELIKDFMFEMDEVDIIIGNYNNIYSCSFWKITKQFGFFDFKYLHELQNGIRLITKSDLEIKEL